VKDANPFETENARRHSSYAAYRDGELVLLLEEGKPVTEQAKFVHGQLRSLILDSSNTVRSLWGRPWLHGQLEQMKCIEALSGSVTQQESRFLLLAKNNFSRTA